MDIKWHEPISRASFASSGANGLSMTLIMGLTAFPGRSDHLLRVLDNGLLTDLWPCMLSHSELSRLKEQTYVYTEKGLDSSCYPDGAPRPGEMDCVGNRAYLFYSDHYVPGRDNPNGWEHLTDSLKPVHVNYLLNRVVFGLNEAGWQELMIELIAPIRLHGKKTFGVLRVSYIGVHKPRNSYVYRFNSKASAIQVGVVEDQ